MQLTEEQQIILDSSSSNLYISAAPGSGKSTMLSFICEKLLRDPEARVMLVTFTNKAAKSIIQKCENADGRRIVGGTFHSIGYRLLKEHGCDRTICDEYKKKLIIKKVLRSKDKELLEDTYDRISHTKMQWPRLAEDQVLQEYNRELDKYGLMDFDDIIYDAIDLIIDDRFKAQAIKYILVDELQDTSGPQLEVLKALQSKLGCKMIGVADDDQAIYSWRNARPQNVWDFINHFGCTTLNMGTNFRSATSIVTSSKRLIENNRQRIVKTIRARPNAPRGLVITYQAYNFLNEIDFIVLKCLQFPENETTILYRNRIHKNHLEFALRKNDIPYQVNDLLEITDRTPVKCILSLLRIASGEYDIYDLENASKCVKALGAKTVKDIAKEAESKPLTEVVTSRLSDPKRCKRLHSIKCVVDEFEEQRGRRLDVLVRYVEDLFISSFNYQEDMRNFLIDISKDFECSRRSIRQLYNELGLSSTEEERDENAKVELSTVHGYKGLERDTVILPWAHQYTQQKDGFEYNEEDERRLFYVAATRAMNSLYITYSGTKPKFVREMKI